METLEYIQVYRRGKLQSSQSKNLWSILGIKNQEGNFRNVSPGNHTKIL